MNIVGYRSPFKKNKVEVKTEQQKESPMKAIDPVTAQLAIAVAPGIIKSIGSLFGRKKRKREQRAAAAEMAKAKAAFEAIEYVNPYADLTNPYAGIENPYAENVFEDLTVNTQSADFLKQQQQQSQANLLANLRSVAGASGVAGLAQSLSNIASNQAQQASASIAQQEQKNKLLAAKGEQQRQRGAFGVEKMQRTGQFQVDQLQAKGEAMRRAQEDARTQALYGLAIDRKSSADRAIQAARSQFFEGLGQAASGVGSLYMPGGARFGKAGDDLFNLSGGRFGTSMPEGGQSPAGYFEDGEFIKF